MRVNQVTQRAEKESKGDSFCTLPSFAAQMPPPLIGEAKHNIRPYGCGFNFPKNRSGGRCFMKTAVGLNDGGRKSKPPFFWWCLLSPYVRGQRLREQTAGVRKRFFGGYRRFFAPSKKWGYINKTNNRIYLHPSVCFADTFPRRRRQTPLPSASPLTGESPQGEANTSSTPQKTDPFPKEWTCFGWGGGISESLRLRIASADQKFCIFDLYFWGVMYGPGGSSSSPK